MGNNNSFASIFGLMGVIFGAFLPFWLGWASLSTDVNVANDSNAITTGLVGPILMGLTGAIVIGLFAMVIGMVIDGYAKKGY